MVQPVKYEGISSLCFCCGRLGHKKENCWYQIKEKEKNGRAEEKSSNRSQEKDKSEDSGAEKSTNQGSEETKSDPNFGPWMLVSRKKNLVRNGRPRSSIGNDGKEAGTSRGMSVQKGIILKGNSAIPCKDKVLSTQSSPSEQVGTVRSVLDHEMAPNEDLENLEMRFSASCPKQGERVIRSDGKLQLGVSGTGNRNTRSNGGKGKKSLKRQYPSSLVSS